jgi:hypothetical protein
MELLHKVVEVFVMDWLFEAGRSLDDGSLIVGRRFYVVAQTPSGHRFAHCRSFCSGRLEEDYAELYQSYTQDWRKDEADAQAYADEVQAYVDAGGKLDLDYWNPIQGAYGTRGWDEAEELALEREEEEFARCA